MKIILHSFVYFSDCDPVGFEEAVQDRRWKEAMDEKSRVSRRIAHGNLPNYRKKRKQLESSGYTKQKRM